MPFLLLLTRVAQFACIIPIVTGLIRYKNMPDTAKVFFYFIVFCGFTEWFAHYLSVTYHNNMPYLYVFTLIEFVAYTYVILPKLLLFGKWTRPLIWGLIFLMLGLMGLDIIIRSVYQWNLISRTTECILIVFLGLAYLLEYFQSDKSSRITQDYIFWIATGAVVYFSISFFYIVIGLFVKSVSLIGNIANTTHLGVSILAYLFFAYSFWISKPGKSHS